MLEVIRHTSCHKPWFGCTATLDNNIWQKVCLSTGMKGAHTPIDRPEVALIRHVVKKADENSFKPLHFVVADASRRQDGTRLGRRSSPGFHEVAASDFTDLDLNSQSSRIVSRSDQSSIPASGSSLQWADTWTPANYSRMSQSLSSTRLEPNGRPSPKDNLRLPPAEELVPCPELIPKTIIMSSHILLCLKSTSSISPRIISCRNPPVGILESPARTNYNCISCRGL